MKHRIRALTLSIALMSLGGCGGGESGAFLFNAFVGFWISDNCEADGASRSERVTIRLTELSETSLSGSFTVETYANTTCSGPPANTVQFAVRQEGTRTVDSGTAVKVTLANPVETLKDLLFVRDRQLFRGLPGPLDADGFPSLIDFSNPLRLL